MTRLNHNINDPVNCFVPHSPPVISEISSGPFIGCKWAGNIATRLRNFLPYDEAKRHVTSLDISSQESWRIYSKSGKKPIEIPGDPERFYKNKGWLSWGDWLGTKRTATRDQSFRSYKSARSYVRKLGIATFAEWREYRETSKKPLDIPSNPNRTYQHSGWKGWGDWLGTGRLATKDKTFLSYKEAQLYINSLKLENRTQWRAYIKSGNKPNNIPAEPSKVYKENGWVRLNDWLGNNISQKKSKRKRR